MRAPAASHCMAKGALRLLFEKREPGRTKPARRGYTVPCLSAGPDFTLSGGRARDVSRRGLYAIGKPRAWQDARRTASHAGFLLSSQSGERPLRDDDQREGRASTQKLPLSAQPDGQGPTFGMALGARSDTGTQ
jgi:hypothetical protein